MSSWQNVTDFEHAKAPIIKVGYRGVCVRN
jgi:hypothetical protein